MTIKKPMWLNANFIKILALITMTIDHIGWILLGGQKVLNIIGRISFPLFAYMIAEGCYYTKKPYKRLLLIFTTGVICQIFFFIFSKSLEQCILITFSMSVVLITILQLAEKRKSFILYILFGVLSGVFFYISHVLPTKINYYGFRVQYDAVGVFLPVAVYLLKDKWLKIIAVALFIAILATMYNDAFYLWGLLAIIPLIFYNGERGKIRLKYLFYFYFPLHFAVLYGIALLI